MSIDPRTVILLAGVMGGLMAVVLYFMRRNYPASIGGLGEWSLASALIFVSTLLLGIRGVVPDFISVVVANLFLLAGLAMFLIGSERFLDRPQQPVLWSGLILATFPILVWFTHVEPHYGIRVMVVSLMMMLLTGRHALVLVHHGRHGFATWLAAAALVVQTAAQGFRLISSFNTMPDSSLFLLSPAQTWFITTYAFCMLMVGIGVVLMATERLRAEFEHIASHDSLTGALTRRAFIEACTQELERARRKDRLTSLLVMDLDHFKNVNDSYGHQAGDRVLVEFVARVSGLLRRPDHFGRFGGEEFVALLPETTLDEAMAVAERIRADVERAAGHPGCTVSLGVATSVPGEGGIDTILARADEALYRAKADGRNCVRKVG